MRRSYDTNFPSKSPGTRANSRRDNDLPPLTYCRLLHEWLRYCDDKHPRCHLKESGFWPTRVIFVGGPNPDKLALVESQESGKDYLALSHCWGSLSDEERTTFRTTKRNVNDRLNSFSYEKLPRTFQHAVDVTRSLKKQYLWIDALCIIQGPDGDWHEEAKKMEKVFSHAYCTIAASSALGCKDGFLRSGLNSPVQDISDPDCACPFDQDVDQGALMRRAWVLQERVLSRRTIHFAAAHTYFECGAGVKCEHSTTLVP